MNCIDCSATVLSVDTLVAGVSCLEGVRSKSPSGGGGVESHINQSLQLVWGTLVRHEIRRRQTKINMAVSAVSRRLKPQ